MNAKTILACAFVAAGPAGLRAEEPTRVPTNGTITVIVEATRLDDTTLETPQFAETFSKKELEDAGARDVMDALAKRSGVFVRHVGGANPALAQVSMRGYGENSAGRVLVRADGETLNNFDMSASDFSRVPLSAVERIEVLHGPQTVMHGGNASAGIINIVTEKPGYGRETSIEMHGGSWNTVGGSVGTKGGDEEEMISYSANGAWDRSDGYRDSSGYDLYRINGAVRKDFENGSFLRFSSFYADSQYDLPGPLTYEEWKRDRRAKDADYSFYNYRMHAYGMNFSGEARINDENSLKFETTLSHRSDRFRAYQKTARYTQDSPFDNYAASFTPQFINVSRIAGFDNEFTLGGTLRRDVRLGYNRYDYPDYPWKQKEDQTRWTFGGFARDEFFLTDDLSLFAGARLERLMTRSESLRHPARNDNLSAFESGFNLRPAENAKLFTKFARFYRSPFVDETNYTRGDIVSPERGWSLDTGAEATFFEEFHAGGALYISETKNEIYYDPFLFDNMNLPGNVRREGFDVNIGWEKKNTASVDLRYAFVNAEITDGDYDGNKMCAVPRQQVSLNARLYLFDGFSVRGGCRYTDEQYTISDFKNEFGKLKAYTLFSLGFQYECPFEPLDGLVVSFDIDNLFDRDYCDYATYGANFYPAAGRSYTAKIGYTF